MKKLYTFTIISLLLVLPPGAIAQYCNNGVPTFNVNLTGQPSGVYTSPSVVRNEFCCGAVAPDKCIAFIVLLDSSANGIKFDIVSGAVPPGALYYQVDCGPPVPVGEPLCLNGPGPHYLTFCKPGNNQNVYAITSLPQPTTYGTEWVSQSCSGQFGVTGLVDTTIVWTSLPPNPVYNSYLSCQQDCPDVTITPPATGVPPTIDYQVCGYVVGGCFPFFFCDTFTVNMVNNLDVNITPQNQIICYGDPDIPITANITGGVAPYQLLWSTGETTQTIIAGAGVYTVQVLDSMNCSIAYDTVTITEVTTPIISNAGTDQLLCMGPASVQLGGSVQTATGGIWSGGTGNFTPGATSLNATYTPSANEIVSGSAQLILTTTGNQGCPPATDTVTITISPNPAPSITGNNNVCEFTTHSYIAPFVTGITYQWNVSGGSIQSTNNNVITVDWGAAGNGTITLTETNTLTCDSTITYNVTINPLPAPVITGPPTICTLSNSSYTLSALPPGNTYSWSVTGGNIIGSATGNTITVSWLNPGNGTITVTETTPFGCDSTVQIPVTIITEPTPVISGPANGCAGQSISYTTPLVAGNTYNWNVTGGTITSNSNNSIIVYWPAATTGTVTVTEFNSLTCDSSVSFSVIVGPQPNPGITGNTNVCTGTTSIYSATNPVIGDMYSWTVVGGTIMGAANSNTVQIQWATAGSAMVILNQSNSFGCDSTISFPVNVLTMPTPSINGNASSCAGQSITYNTPFISGNSYIWNVTGGTITSNSNNSITVFWPSAVNGTVTLTEANTFSCDSTVTLNVVIGPQPAPSINGPITVCTTDQYTYSISNSTSGNLLIWSVTGGTIIGPTNGTSVLVEWSTVGNQTLTLTESNNYNCDATVSVIVNVRLKPAPDLNGPNSSCEALYATYSVQNVPGFTYQWSVTGGSVIGTVINNSIDVLWTTPGFGLVKVNVMSPQGCDSTVSIPVTIYPAPRPAVSGPGIVCTGESVILSTSFTAGNTYSWTANNAVISGSTLTNSIAVNLNNAGTASLTVTETTINGCIQQATFQILVNEKPEPVISGSDIGCISSQPYQYSTTVQPFVSYQWNVTGGQITAGVGTPSISVQWTNSGQQVITLIATNILNGCDSIITMNVLTGDLPVPVIDAPVLSGCSPITVNFAGNAVNQQYQYNWDFGDGSFGSGANPSHIYNSPGTFNVTLSASNNTGCSYSTSAVIETFPSPVSQFNMIFGTELYYTEISTLTLTNLSSGANQYLWMFGNGDTSSLFEPNYIYTQPGTYAITLLVTNQNGCTDISKQLIEVIAPEHLYLPNAFSPNNDNINDYFSSGNWNIKELYIAIYNRWGDPIYTSGGIDFKWDGTYKGRPVPQGVYVYKIAAKGIRGEEFNKMGTVTLIR